MDVKKFAVGGTTLAIQSEGIRFKDWPHPFYALFRTQRPAEIRISLKRSQGLPHPRKSSPLLFDGSSHWQLFQEDSHYHMLLYDSRDESLNKSAILSPDFSNVTVYLARPAWHINRILRPLGEIIFVNYLAPRGGLLLHAAAIRDHAQAYLFVGESGAGKTTMSEFWANKEGDYSVLGDERIIVRREGGKWYVYGTPWPGMGFRVANERVPISRVFFIRHGKENKITQPGGLALFQALFTEAFSAFWNKEALAEITKTCELLIREVPCYELAFTKDAGVTDFIQDFARAHH